MDKANHWEHKAVEEKNNCEKMVEEVKKANNTIQTLTNASNNLVKIAKEHIWGQILVMSNSLYEWF